MNKNKTLTTFNKRLKIILILCLIFISALLIGKNIVIAKLVQRTASEKEHRGGGVVTYEDLAGNYDILCCQHGTHIPDESKFIQTITDSDCNETYKYDSRETTITEGTVLNHTHTCGEDSTAFSLSTTQTESPAVYSLKEHMILRPMAAYILADMKDNEGAYPADVQNAWWGTPEGGEGNGPDYEGGLLLEARAFEQYIKSIAEKDADGNIVYENQEYKLYDSKGNVTETGNIDAPKLKYEPEWNKDADQSGSVTKADKVNITFNPQYRNPKTGKDEQVYMIGPFSINYVLDGVTVTSDYVRQPNAERGEKESVKEREERLKKEAEEAAAGEAEAGDVEIGGEEITIEDSGIVWDDEFSSAGSVASVNETENLENGISGKTNTVGMAEVGAVEGEGEDEEQDDNNTDLTQEQKYFAMIEKAELWTNKGKMKFGAKKDWEFIWIKDGETPRNGIDDPYKYPYPNEVFYIKLKYDPEITEIRKFQFTFAYMNAGGYADKYDGTYSTYDWSIEHTDSTTTECDDPDCTDDHYESTTDKVNVKVNGDNDAQTLAFGIFAVKWWEKAYLVWDKKWSDIPIGGPEEYVGFVKVVKNIKDNTSEGKDIMPINDTFHFDLYVNGKFYQQITVNTVDGIGEATSEPILWREGESAPTYKLVEVGYDEKKYEPRGPWEGTVGSGETIEILAENFVNKPSKGKLTINKEILNPTEEILDRTFTFNIEFTGKFFYQNKWITCDDENPFKIENIKINKESGWTWSSDEFKWYESAPKYKIEEVIKPNDPFELIGDINQGEGYLRGEIGEDTQETVALASNTPTDKEGVIEIDKTFINMTPALNSETFYCKVVVKGRFTYEDDGDTELEEKIFDEEHANMIILNESNNWTWTSNKFRWKGDEAPTYTVEEVFKEDYDGNAVLVSISDQTNNKSVVNDNDKNDENIQLKSTLQPGKTVVVVTNKENKKVRAIIRIIKHLENYDASKLKNKVFHFKLTLKAKGNSTFNYGDEKNLKEKVVDNIELKADPATGELQFYWESPEISWREEDSAPDYTVEEIIKDSEIDEFDFVSISNGEKTVTTEPKISGTLTPDDVIDITAINKENDDGPDDLKAKIRIIKLLNGRNIGELTKEQRTFKFRVTISGTFTYEGKEYKNETLTIEPIEITVDEYGYGAWESTDITWEKGQKTPSYTVEEIGLSDDVSFVSMSNRLQTVKTRKITGALQPNTVAYVIARNRVKREKIGYLKIIKKVQHNDLKGLAFKMNVKLEGKFTYGGKPDGKKVDGELIIDSAHGEEDVIITPDEVWMSKEIRWREDDPAPTYTISEDLDWIAEQGKENEIYRKVKFVSISNGMQLNTSNSITGRIYETKIIYGFNEAENEIDWVIRTPITVVTVVNTKDVPKWYRGRLQIQKKLTDSNGNEIKDKVFYFKVTLEVKDKETKEIKRGPYEYIVKVTAGHLWRSGYFYWLDGEQIDYHIEEVNMPGGYHTKSIDPKEGTLEAEDQSEHKTGLIQVTAENETELHKGKLKIKKDIKISDKLSADDVTGTFRFDVTITGTFRYKGATYVDKTITLNAVVSKNTDYKWESDEIEWFGDEAPYYGVEEVAVPDGWRQISITDNASGRLQDGATIEILAVNEWNYVQKIILTMQMGGKVWDDTDRTVDKYVKKGEDGVYKDGEVGIEGVKVVIYRVLPDGTRMDGVYAYDEQNQITPIEPYKYTDELGNWSFGNISVPAYRNDEEAAAYGWQQLSYEVEFWYDGQTYEPTTFLKSSNGNASAFKNAATSDKDKFYYDSMAIDKNDEREAFNSGFETISGGSPMDAEGKTKSPQGLNYTSVDSVSLLNADYTRKVSTLETKDEDGHVYDNLIMKASTKTGGLTYPFDRMIHLVDWDKKITDILEITYYYSATYNYLKSINLGLIQREAADLSLEKDLDTATVIINGKVLRYKYNRAYDLNNPDNSDLLYKQIAVDNEQLEYKLGLYSGDYYYRANMLTTGDEKDFDSTGGSALSEFYGKLGLGIESTEMDVFLKYRIVVYNESETYDVKVNNVIDYFDETYELVTSNTYEGARRYVQTLNGKPVEGVVQLAEHPTATYYNAKNEEQETIDVGWGQMPGTITDSNGYKYKVMQTSSLVNREKNDGKLASGERVEAYITFKVKKADIVIKDIGTIQRAIQTGTKHNIAEVMAFSAYYSKTSKHRWPANDKGKPAGRVDEDSAPDNINIKELNEPTYYEDDTDSAPAIVIDLVGEDEERSIEGLVWDDAQTNRIAYNQMLGNGKYNPEEGDKPIGGLTTEIVEIISVPEVNNDGTLKKDSKGNIIYKDYEHEWDTDYKWPELANKTLEELTGFKQSITTSKKAGHVGEYAFTSVPAGVYKVRFVYGDKVVGTGNKGFQEVYSGADYKSTAYQAGFSDKNVDKDGYIVNEWQDLSNAELNAARVSDARDNEARRLYITSKSEMLTYDNNHVLDYADDKKGIKIDETEDDAETIAEKQKKQEELFGNFKDAYEKVTGRKVEEVNDDTIITKGYYMYADTAKINVAVENVYNIDTAKEDKKTSILKKANSNVEIGKQKLDYIVGDINSSTTPVGTKDFSYVVKNIDCGIEERSVTNVTLDKQIREILLSTPEQVILDAIFDITYNISENGEINVSVDLNRQQSVGIDHIAPLNREKNFQGYRYIIVEGDMLQGTTTTVKYQLTVFNSGEADRTTETQDTLWKELNSNKFNTKEDARKELHNVLKTLTTPYYVENVGRVYANDFEKVLPYGTYLGRIYYLGRELTDGEKEESKKDGIKEEILVSTKLHQMIDYIDSDIDFIVTDNNTKDQSWATTQIQYLLDNKLVDPEVVKVVDEEGNLITKDEEGKIPVTAKDRYNEETGEFTLSEGERFTIINKDYREYITETKNNIILSIDNGGPEDEVETEESPEATEATEEKDNPDEGMGTNPGFVKKLYPFSSTVIDPKLSDEEKAKKEAEAYEKSIATIAVQSSRYYSSESDGSDVDNIAEIVKYENSVGRRDYRSVTGNADTFAQDEEGEPIGEYAEAGKEPDTDATERITLSPPNGLESGVRRTIQLVSVALVATVILAIGIVIIRKKVLSNK